MHKNETNTSANLSAKLVVFQRINTVREVSIIVGLVLLIATGINEVAFNNTMTLRDLGIMLLAIIPFFTAAFINASHPFNGRINYPFLAILPFVAIGASAYCGNRPFTVMNSILWLYVCSGISYKRAFFLNILLLIFYLVLDYFISHFTAEMRIYSNIYLNGGSVFGFISAYNQQNIQEELKHQHKLAVTSAQKLEDKLNYKSELYTGLAHEVKTPLTIIRHYFSKYRKNNDDSRELQILQDNLDKLERQIVNFLKYEREHILSSDSEKNEGHGCCGLSTLIQKNIPLLQLYFERKNVKLSADIEPNIIVGITQIDCEHIFLNLIENALRYTPTGGNVSISLNKEGESALLKISDTGIGIEPEYIDQIFEPHIQIKDISSSKQGFGMGLFIVKTIITRVNGNIKVDSIPGEGSLFTVALPVEDSVDGGTVSDLILPINFTGVTKTEKKIKRFNAEGKTQKLMIVEDNDDLREFLEEYLSDEYDVLSFRNGQHALFNIDQGNIPDIIISDIYMDEMDGLTLLDNFNERFPKSSVPFVFISADDTERMRLTGLGKGAVDYIVKPFSPEELRLKIALWLSLFSSQKDEELERINKLSNKYGLTSKENQIVLMITQGHSRKKISEKLFISLNTVKTHITSIYQKCNVSSRDELIEFIRNIQTK